MYLHSLPFPLFLVLFLVQNTYRAYCSRAFLLEISWQITMDVYPWFWFTFLTTQQTHLSSKKHRTVREWWKNIGLKLINYDLHQFFTMMLWCKQWLHCNIIALCAPLGAFDSNETLGAFQRWVGIELYVFVSLETGNSGHSGGSFYCNAEKLKSHQTKMFFTQKQSYILLVNYSTGMKQSCMNWY